MEESRQGWRRGGKGRTPATSSGKGWQSRKQPAAKTGAARHRTRLVALGLATVTLLVVYIILVLRVPPDMPLVVVGVATYESPIPPNAYVSEDAKRLAGTNPDNIKHMPAKADRIVGREALEGYLKESLRPVASFVRPKIITVYVSAHGVVDSHGQACLLLSDSKPLDETTWYPISKLFELLEKERPDAVKVLLLDSGKIDANWSLGILYNEFPDRVADALRNRSNIFVITDRASGELAWSAPERGGTIFGHFVASGLSAAADADKRNGVSLLEFYDFVRTHVEAWVNDNRSSRQTPQLFPQPTAEQNIKLVAAGTSPSENGSAKAHVSELSSKWRNDLMPLWNRYEAFVDEVKLQRYDPLGLATIEAELLRAEQLLLAGGAYEIQYDNSLTNISSLMRDSAGLSLPGELRGFSLPMAAQLESGFDPETSGQELIAALMKTGDSPKEEEGNGKKPVSPSYLEAANAAVQWLLKCEPEPGGQQLREALRLFETSGRHVDEQGKPIEDVQEVQLVKLVSEHADVTDLDNWPRALRAALRQAMLAQKMAEQIAAPADERAHYWVQPLLNRVDQRRRIALDRIFIGDDASLTAARDELAQCQTQEGAEAELLLREVADAYKLRDHVCARLPHLAFWFSQQGLLDARQPGLDLARKRVAELSDLLDADDTTARLEVTDNYRSIVKELDATRDNLESEFGSHVKLLLESTPASGTLLKAHHILRTPLTTARDREGIFVKKYLGSMALDHHESDSADKPLSTDPRKSTEPPTLTLWPTHPAVLFAGDDESTAPGESGAEQDASVSWFDVQGGFLRDALRDISNKKAKLQQATELLLRSEETNATARRTRLDLAKADTTVRFAAALLGRRPWTMDADPTRRLRHVDRHFQLLWHSHRVLDDFWGPTDGQNNLPYFANVANSYLAGANTLEETSSVLGYGNEPNLNLLCERRIAATAIGITAAAQLKCYEPEKPNETDYEFRVSWPSDLPPGQAAVFITEGVGNSARLFPAVVESANVRRRGQDVDKSDGKVEQRLRLDKPPADNVLPLAAQVLYRGHKKSQPFIAEWPKHILAVRADYARPVEATVTVEGDRKGTAYIMFIVDCSASMGENARMTKAKASLDLVVDQLGDEPNYQLGLRAYGRTSGFEVKRVDGDLIPVRNAQGEAIVKHPVSAGVDQKQVHPDEDADDLLVRFGKFDRVKQVEEVKERIRDLNPFGVTPLYRALKVSISDDFGRTTPGDSKHIVLITDGEDSFTGLQALGQEPTRTLAGDVEAAWKKYGSDVRIHIIFMEPPNTIEKALTDLPKKTKGTYRGLTRVPKEAVGAGQGPTEVDALVQAIQEAIGLVKFTVDPSKKSDSSAPDTTKHDLGETAKVTELRQNYEVRIHGAPGGEPPMRKIYIDGGEAIRLVYLHEFQRSPQLLFPIEYPDRAYGKPTNVAGLTPERERHEFIIRALRPDVNGADVDFFVTVQDVTGTSAGDSRTAHFTPPVRQVWCEITPVVGNSPRADRIYYFYDVDNVLNQPVPMLRFHAKDWSRDATAAQIKLWFSFNRIAPAPTGPNRIEIKSSGESQSLVLAGIEFEASGQKRNADEPYRITAFEKNTSLGTFALFVIPAPDAVEHTFHRFGGTSRDVVKHVYDFEDRLNASIYVLPSRQLKTNPEFISVPQIDVIWKE